MERGWIITRCGLWLFGTRSSSGKLTQRKSARRTSCPDGWAICHLAHRWLRLVYIWRVPASYFADPPDESAECGIETQKGCLWFPRGPARHRDRSACFVETAKRAIERQQDHARKKKESHNIPIKLQFLENSSRNGSWRTRTEALVIEVPTWQDCHVIDPINHQVLWTST